MAYYATLEEVEMELAEGYGWVHQPELDGSQDGEWCHGSRIYKHEDYPTWSITVANLGTDDAFAAIENDRGQQFADCDLYTYAYEGEEMDYLLSMLNAVHRGAYNQFL